MTSRLDADLLDVLHDAGVDLIVTVPCKHFAGFLEAAGADDRFEVLVPTREDEGLGIVAGAYLAGRRGLLLIQNSGLGVLVNAYCSLARFYELPLLLMASHRGDELERVPAQVPMGRLTPDLLRTLDIPCRVLARPEDLSLVRAGLAESGSDARGRAFLVKKPFWGG